MKNVVLITSTINPPNVPLWHTNVRSVYTPEERYIQTLNTIHSVKNFIPQCDIVLLENSDLAVEQEAVLKNNVTIYKNYRDDNDIDTLHVNKGITEIMVLNKYITTNFETLKNYTRIFKLSGRYIITSYFNINYHRDSDFTLCYFNINDRCFATFFYSFDPNQFLNVLQLFDKIMYHNSDFTISIEQHVTNYINSSHHNVLIPPLMGVRGNIAVHGELYER